MKRLILLLFMIAINISFTQISSHLYNGELKIKIINISPNISLEFTAEKVNNTLHWDFNNNLILNNDYTFQTNLVFYPIDVVYFYWRNGETNGMGKGYYIIKAKDSNGNILAYFFYDLRTSKTFSGSPDLEVIFDAANNNFILLSKIINSISIAAWEYVPVLCCEQETDKFEPTAPTNVGVFSNGEHPFIYWSNNEFGDYWTNIEVYRSEVYSGPPDSFQLIAILDENATTYYDTKYSTGSGAIAYYKVRKVNNNKYSSFSNTASINIMPKNLSNIKTNMVKESNSEENRFNFVKLNANNISLYLKNIGNLKNYTGAGGGFWYLLKDSLIIFDHGPWVIGKIDNKIYLSLVQWYRNYESSIFSPGPIINNKPAIVYNPIDSLKYRIYKIEKNDFKSKDYLEWPKDYGAPTTKDGKPILYGEQTTWCVYNALDPKTSYREIWNVQKDSLPIMPIEIQQLVYSRGFNGASEDDLFSNVVFYEYTLINKGNKQIDSAYFSFWADIDFSSGINNFPACDSSLDLGYLWSNKTQEQPAIGYFLLYGPTISKAGGKSVIKGKQVENKINLKLTAFHGILEDANNINEPGKPASSRIEAWNIARGLYIDGKKMINPINNNLTNFMFDGDPVSNLGWIYNYSSGGEAGFNLFTGPFNLSANDTQWVMLVLVAANGKDYKESISKLRKKVEIIKSLSYDSLAFGNQNIIVKNEEIQTLPNSFTLFQNYPNPFNPETTISYTLPAVMFKQSNKDKQDDILVTLKVFDVLGKEVSTLVDERQKAGTYHYQFSRDNYHLPTGVYFYQLKAGNFIQTRKMILMK